MPKTPRYRKRHDRNQAIVTLTDSETGRRRDYWLGAPGSRESRERYHRVVAEWESAGRRLPEPEPALAARHAPAEEPDGVTVSAVCVRFWRDRGPRLEGRDRGHFRTLIRLLRRSYGGTPAASFGPLRLQRLRDDMARGDTTGETNRRPWSVTYANAQVRRLCRVFRWAASQELVPAAVYQQLLAVEPLRAGKCDAKPPRVVTPVPDEAVDATLPFLASPVRAVVLLQRLTGARPSELLELRRGDIDTDAAPGVWAARPRRHKTQGLGRTREIFLGPRAQEVLAPFMSRGAQEFLFSPREAEAERRAARAAARKTPISCGNRAGTNRKPEPMKSAGDRYDARSYYRAVQYACDAAFPPPAPLAKGDWETRAEWRARLKKSGLDKRLAEWRQEHRWFPYQLRHAAATALRRAHGLEASALALGHASARVTDAVYAQRDQKKVADLMRRVG